MHATEYQRMAMRTKGDLDGKEQLAAAAMGLSGEAGEVTDAIKKVMFHDHTYDPDKIAEELGDVMWYAALLADAIGTTLSQVMRRNIAKLLERYPDGFDPERSKNRQAGSGE